MIIGASVVKLDLRMSLIDKIPFALLSIAYAVLIIIDIYLKINFGIEEVLHRLCYIVGILFFIRVSKTIYYHDHVKNLFISISKWTFIIYAGHEPALTALRKLCAYFLPRVPIVMLVEYLLLPIFMIVVCVTGGYILHRYLPKIYGLITGER